MADLSNRLTLGQLKETEEYQRLTEKQQLWVATYCEGGLMDGHYDSVSATRTAYVCKSPETARIMSYSMLSNPKIIAVLNRHFNKTPTQEFIQQIDTALRNKRISIAQVELLRIKCNLLGIPNRLPSEKMANQGVIPPDILENERELRKKQNAGKERKKPGPKPKEESSDYGFDK